MIRLDDVTQYVVIAGLVGAIVWDLLTWWWGLPTSSSHALIGGFAGAGAAYAGFDVLNWDPLLTTMKFIVLAPLIGLVLGFLIMLATSWLLRRWRPLAVDKTFRRGQLL